MIRAILLDMDDTLLRYPNGARGFVADNLSKLDAFFAKKLGLPDFRTVILHAVQAVVNNLDPTLTNAEVYWQTLMAAVGEEVSETRLQDALNDFYASDYRLLKTHTEPIDEVPQLLAAVFATGLPVVIATNPLYPQIAIEERLRWAGLDPAALDVARITATENSHFSKPHPQYYEEILAHIGVEAYEALMIGDSWGNDIRGAAQAGLHTYWLKTPHQNVPDATLPSAMGSHTDLLGCLQNPDWLASLTPKPFAPQHVAPRMQGNVAALLGMVATVPDHFWQQRPFPEEWTPIEIVRHLVESERDVQRPRLQRIAKEDNPFLSVPKTPPQVGEWHCESDDGHALAYDFAKQRAETIAFLGQLPPETWQRPARDAIYGPTTLLEMAIFTTRHDHLHIEQLCQTLGRCE